MIAYRMIEGIQGGQCGTGSLQCAVGGESYPVSGYKALDFVLFDLLHTSDRRGFFECIDRCNLYFIQRF